MPPWLGRRVKRIYRTILNKYLGRYTRIYIIQARGRIKGLRVEPSAGSRVHVRGTKPPTLKLFFIPDNQFCVQFCTQNVLNMGRGGLARRETGRFPGGPLLQKVYRAPTSKIRTKINCCHQMHFPGSTYAKNAFGAGALPRSPPGLCPGPRWGAYSSPQTH